MPLTDWIKGHQILVGTIVICILLIIVSVIVFLIIRSIKKRLIGGRLDVPSKPPRGYETNIPFLERIKKRIKINKPMECRVHSESRQGMSAMTLPRAMEASNMAKIIKKKSAPIGQAPVAPAVDVNALTVEQLEQLLSEKKAAAAVQTKQATLMAMPKEELVQLIIDNQIEI